MGMKLGPEARLPKGKILGFQDLTSFEGGRALDRSLVP